MQSSKVEKGVCTIVSLRSQPLPFLHHLNATAAGCLTRWKQSQKPLGASAYGSLSASELVLIVQLPKDRAIEPWVRTRAPAVVSKVA